MPLEEANKTSSYSFVTLRTKLLKQDIVQYVLLNLVFYTDSIILD